MPPKNVSEDCHTHLESAEATLNSLTKNRRLARLLRVNGCSMRNAFQSKKVELFVSFFELFKTCFDVAANEGLIKKTATGIFFHICFRAITRVVVHWFNGGASLFSESLRLINEVLVDELCSTSNQARCL